ncbi:hypothetical protein MRB53_034692 [Persea americana]|uniref:Uncharacterized protein n=1 Tax=Persea americana TaxID=3435 RepID=A0ACC2K2J4_PERAE|nr:hypothetical protein MRB53_034692 [Persea americana]
MCHLGRVKRLTSPGRLLVVIFSVWEKIDLEVGHGRSPEKRERTAAAVPLLVAGIAPRREAALPVPLVTGKLLESSPRVAGVRVAVAVLVRRWSGSVSETRTRGSRQVKKGCPFFSRHLRTVAAC